MQEAPFNPWPCADFSSYPLAANWSTTFPKHRISQLNYDRGVGVIRTLFMSPPLTDVIAKLRQYCFQQGVQTNANRMDLEFFYNILSHDMPFFLGHKQVEILQAFPEEAKLSSCLNLVKASHFDFYRVIKRWPFGFARLESLTSGKLVTTFSAFDDPTECGDCIFGRVLPVGFLPGPFAHSLIEPWDTVDADIFDDVMAIFDKQYSSFCTRFPECTKAAFLKIAAYHVYEMIQGHELVPILNKKLANIEDQIYARTLTLHFKNQEDLPKLTDIEGATYVLDCDGENIESLATASISSADHIPKTLREAIISIEGKNLEITLFMENAGNSFYKAHIAPMVAKFNLEETTTVLDINETYRSLRHLSI